MLKPGSTAPIIRQRAAPIFVGEFMPIAVDAALRAAFAQRRNETTVPIENRASSVEGKHVDALHRKLPQPDVRTRAPGTMKLPAINLSRSSSLARCISRTAWTAAPAAVSFQNQSASCRLDGLARPAAPASRQ